MPRLSGPQLSAQAQAVLERIPGPGSTMPLSTLLVALVLTEAKRRLDRVSVMASAPERPG